MKELYIIRHAKSDWEHAHLDDFERPLNDRGLRDAPRVARTIAGRWLRPDVILSSPATRAYQTALFFRKEWKVDWAEFSLLNAVYEATADDLFQALTRFSSGVERIALFGHNPGVSVLVSRLTRNVVELKTCCGAKLSIPSSGLQWSECHLIDTFRPSDL